MKRLFFLLLFLYTIGAFSQEKIRSLADLKGKKDLKVGLVLSGGGAKGLAHIAALEAIEKAGVEIDYIGGTSMGAIVGGLYAAGYSAQQLDSIFHATERRLFRTMFLAPHRLSMKRRTETAIWCPWRYAMENSRFPLDLLKE